MKSLATHNRIGLNSTLSKWLMPFITIGLTLIAILWLVDSVTPDNLLYNIDWKYPIASLETSWLYLLLHVFIALPVFALSFDKKVAYYKCWKPLLYSIAIIGSLFIIWDVYFTHVEVWGFNKDYITGYKLFLLPIEEWLFFITVPFACVFIYECLNAYIKKDILVSFDNYISSFLILVFFTIGILNWGKLYTCTTFLLAGSYLLYHHIFIPNRYRTRFYLAFLVSLLPFLIINGILTGGYTQNPIVVYNPEEYLGVRITSIPLDDSVYCFAYLLMVVTLYERFKK